MFGFHKKNSWFVFVKDFISAKNLDSTDDIFRKVENSKKSFWWLFFYTYRRQILFVSVIQTFLLSFILCFPYAIDFYLQFFLRSTSPIAQARLFTASVYLLLFIVLFSFILYVKNKVLIQWARVIKYHSLLLIAKICENSEKNSSQFLYRNFINGNDEQIIDKCAFFPKILIGFFSIPALFVAYYLIYKIMGNIFFVPLALLLSLFVFQYFSNSKLTHIFQKISQLSLFRSELLKKIFSYGNRVRYLAMESFFLRKINLSQEYAQKISKGILKNIAFSRVIYYASGFVIAIPSLAIFAYLNKSMSSSDLTKLVILFILVAHFYANTLYLLSTSKEWKNLFEKYRFPILLKQNFSKDSKIQENWEQEWENILNDPKNKKTNSSKLYLQNASFFSPEGLCLYNLSFETKPGQLIAVVGHKSAGKSAFLNACAGELHLVSGEASFAQNFEILSKMNILFEGTLRENIILGREFEGRRYIETIRSCALEEEMNALENGDETVVFPSVNIFTKSFIKKICIARTIYGKADYYYFNDPFLDLSKEDASHIFNEALQKQLVNSVRIFVTEKLEFASLCHQILVMKDGIIVEQGAHSSLVEKSGAYARLYYASADSRRFEFSQYQQIKKTQNFRSPLLNVSQKLDDPAENAEGKKVENIYYKSVFNSLKYFVKYFFKDKRAWPSFGLALLSQFFLCSAFFILFSEYFQERMTHFWQVSLFCTFAIFSLVSFFYFHLKNAGINSFLGSSLEKKVYDILIKDHKHEISYTAQYIEEFSLVKDKLFSTFTSLLVRSVFFLAGCFLLAITNLSALCLILGMIAFVSVFILINKNKFYHALTNIKLELNKLSHFSKYFFSLYTQAHSYSLRNYLLEKFQADINNTQKIESEKDKIIVKFSLFILAFFCFLVCVSLVYFVSFYDVISAGTVTLVVVATILFFQAIFNITNEMNTFIACLPHFENLIRTSIMHEENEDIRYSTSEYWPQKGTLRIMSLTSQGTDSYPKPIKNLDLFISHASRLAILEYGDNAKLSPFFATLLQFVPFQEGTIFLDDEDILKINPIELRNRFAYISLNSFFPFLSLRENLDPFEYFDDSEIWSVLNRVGMAQSVAILRNGLNSKMDEFPNQLLWSGELVLISFAKALLHGNKILLLDNVSVPEEIEMRIIDLIEREFVDSTILISTDAKSPLIQLCPDVICIENGEMHRVNAEKGNYHIPISYEDIEYHKFQ
ncbi:ATP-binding cassette domain-containing protein [Fluviispira vulneris]|uniref:ATP-binding cassette domain-containing protein n=1 Tax=Fluviispira vulneris TaxID=2763012 RepID=UPI001648EB31|nr:ATP-binding cassette domain-containing protein [Fluviispira vulneris]